MKRSIVTAITLSMIGVTTVVFTGCSSKEPESIKAQAECQINGSEAPLWVCGNSDPNVNLPIYTAVGSAPMSKIGYSFSVREAEADARSNLAQRVETEVKDKIERFARSTGVASNEVADKVSTQVSKQVSRITLSDSKQIRTWQHPEDKTLFVMISVDRNNVNRSAKQGVLSSFKNDDALWQQFQSEKALKGLEEEFKDKPST